MTLRSVERGWDAKGLLAPLWAQLDGRPKRERLAELTGISPQNLSAYNSGARKLGARNGRKIAAALGVSVLELGAPVAEAGGRDTLRSRLEEVEAALNALAPQVTKLALRVLTLEKQAQTRTPRAAKSQ